MAESLMILPTTFSRKIRVSDFPLRLSRPSRKKYNFFPQNIQRFSAKYTTFFLRIQNYWGENLRHSTRVDRQTLPRPPPVVRCEELRPRTGPVACGDSASGCAFHAFCGKMLYEKSQARFCGLPELRRRQISVL